MPRPKLEPHLRTLLTNERTVIGSLFQISGREGFYCSLYAPGDSVAAVLDHGSLYGYGYGDNAEDAVYAARDKLWKGL